MMMENNFNARVEQVFEKIKNQKDIDVTLLSYMYCLACVRKVQIEIPESTTFDISTLNELEDFLSEYIFYFGKDVYDAILSLLQNKLSEDVFALIADFMLDTTFLIDLKSISEFSNFITVKYLENITNNDHSTPEWLNRLAISILNPIDGSFFDGVSGLGNTAFTAFNHSLKNHGTLYLYTQEINNVISNIFIVRAFLENIKNNRHICCDTLTEQFLLTDNLRVDYSVMFPPLGMSNNIGNVYSTHLQKLFPNIDISKITQEWCFALIQIAMLKDTGSGLISMSNGALFNSMSKDIRKAILNMNIIEAIISFPANSLNNTASPTNFILFNKKKKADSKILMLNAEPLMDTNTISSNRKRFVLSEESKNDLIGTYLKNQPAKNICKLVNKSEIIDLNLLPSKYIKKIIVETQDFGEVTISPNVENLSSDGEWIPLCELVDITIGMNNAKFTEIDPNGEIKIIKLSDIQNGVFQFNTIQNYRLIDRDIKKLHKYKIAESDILLSCKGPAIKVCSVPQIENNYYISSNFFSLRAKENKIHPLYLKYYLESPIGQYFIKSRQTGSTIIMINSSEIKTLPIFYIPLAEQHTLVEKLYADELEIKNQMESLSKKLVDAKRKFYDNIGIERYMNFNKEDNE